MKRGLQLRQGAGSFPTMLSPLILGNGVTLRNRVVMGSMHTGLEEAHGGKLTKMAAFYEARARGGAGLIVTGGIAPNRQGWVSPFAAKLTNAGEAAKHLEVTESVHRHGGKIAMQILHSGRYGYHPLLVAPSPIKAPIGFFTPREMSHEMVLSTIDDYARSAALAAEANYDGVEIMGSEGYLINQFIASRTNKRSDQWGGSYENRIKLALEVVRKCRESVNPDFIIMFRLSMLDLVEGGSTWPEVVQLAQELEGAGVDIINTGIGWHEARIPTIAASVPRGGFSWVTRKMKEEGGLKVPLCATNRINMPETCEDILSSGDADLVSMARPFLADPDIINKANEGRTEDINTCIGCNQACLDHTFKLLTASCLVNPSCGYETDLGPAVAAKISTPPLKVAVVGAGPAGLSAAVTASDRGHTVTLFDQSDEIGGQFNLAKKIPGKEEFHETIRYFTERLSKSTVSLKLGKTVGDTDLLGFDRVILATGVTSRPLAIPGGDHKKVLTYADVITGTATVGKSVAIVGAGGIGFDVAELLTHRESDNDPVEAFTREWGVDMEHKSRSGLIGKEVKQLASRKKVYLLQRTEGKPGAGLGKTTGWIHRLTLAKAGVEMMGGVKEYVKVDDDGLHIVLHKPRGGWRSPPAEGEEVHEDGSRSMLLAVDSVVVCAGQEPLRELQKPLKQSGIPTFLVGGAEAAGGLDAKRAIDQGTRLAAVLETAKDGSVFNQPVKWEAALVKGIRRLAGRSFA